MTEHADETPKWTDLFGIDPHYTCVPLPRVGAEVEVEGTVRTVETLHPAGHYRITLDVKWCPDPDTCPVLTPTQAATS